MYVEEARRVESSHFSLAGVEFDKKFTVIALLMVLVPTADHYFDYSGWFVDMVPWFEGLKRHYLVYLFDAVFIYLPIPVLCILFVFRERLVDYGFTVGNWREGLLWTIGGSAAVTVAIVALFSVLDLQNFYRNFFYLGGGEPTLRDHMAMIGLNFVMMFAWEFMWRGFVLFGLAGKLGAGGAILIQTVPFAILHFGKPFIETLVSPFFGIFYGIVAWRTKSFYYPVLLHIYMFALTNLLATEAVG